MMHKTFHINVSIGGNNAELWASYSVKPYFLIKCELCLPAILQRLMSTEELAICVKNIASSLNLCLAWLPGKIYWRDF
jgi:hypothetical protein